MNIGKASASFNRLFIRKRQRPEASPPEGLFPNEGLNTASPLPGIKSRGNRPPPAKCSRRARTTAAWIFRLYAGAVYK